MAVGLQRGTRQCATAHSLSLMSLTSPVHHHHLSSLAMTCAYNLQTSSLRPGGARRDAGRLATTNVPELPQLPQETTAAGMAPRPYCTWLPVVDSLLWAESCCLLRPLVPPAGIEVER